MLVYFNSCVVDGLNKYNAKIPNDMFIAHWHLKHKFKIVLFDLNGAIKLDLK